MAICIDCGQSKRALKKVWRKHKGAIVETYICADKTKCVGSKAFEKELLKKLGFKKGIIKKIRI